MRGYTRMLLGLSVGILLVGLGTMMAVGGMHSVAWEGDSTPTPTPVSDNPLINQYFAEADQLMCIGDFPGAVEVYNQAIAADPTFALAYIGHSAAYISDNSPDFSVDVLFADADAAIRVATDSGEGYAVRGIAYLMIEDYEAALTDLTKAIPLLPSDTQESLYLVRADVYQAMDKPDLAMQDALYVLELDPHDTEALMYLAWLYIVMEDYESALYYADRAVQYMQEKGEPRECVPQRKYDSEIMVTRGTVYSRLSEYGAAIQDYTDALTFNPDNYGAYEGRGRAYAGLGQSDNALSDFFRMIELESNHTTGYGLIAAVYYMEGNYAKAIAYADRAILLAADNYEGFLYRGLGYWGIRDYDAAIADFSQAITLNPTSTVAYQARGLVHNQLGHKAEALADLKEYHRLVGEAIDPETLDLIERLEAELGK